jgi:hypothetical protein
MAGVECSDYQPRRLHMRAGITKENIAGCTKFVIRGLEGARQEIASFWTYAEAFAYAKKYIWRKE